MWASFVPGPILYTREPRTTVVSNGSPLSSNISDRLDAGRFNVDAVDVDVDVVFPLALRLTLNRFDGCAIKDDIDPFMKVDLVAAYAASRPTLLLLFMLLGE
jgi:hypothetical protein